MWSRQPDWRVLYASLSDKDGGAVIYGADATGGVVNAATVILGGGGSTFGQLGAGSAYQDVSTTNDPGGRIVEFMLRLNF